MTVDVDMARSVTGKGQAQTGPAVVPGSGGVAPHGVELRHLRYFVAVADAGTFTHAAERMFIAQPTLSQQIRRLEEMMGTQLLQRRREGVRLTEAGSVLLEESRAVLSLVDHGVGRARQADDVELVFPVGGHVPEAVGVHVPEYVGRRQSVFQSLQDETCPGPAALPCRTRTLLPK